MRLLAPLILSAVIGASITRNQNEQDIRELKLKDWAPRSIMVTKVTRIEKAAFPVIDIHNHLGSGKQSLTADRVIQIGRQSVVTVVVDQAGPVN